MCFPVKVCKNTFFEKHLRKATSKQENSSLKPAKNKLEQYMTFIQR